MMVDKSFIDTNVLLRSRLDGIPLHIEAKTLVAAERARGNELWISRQVIREFIVQVTHPRTLGIPLTPGEIETHLSSMYTLFRVADDKGTVTDQLIALLKIYPTAGKQVHDANIVATMLVNGIDRLLTQNVDDMKRFSDRITLVPLIAVP
jgi:predicted nucleic acid-binding protein